MRKAGAGTYVSIGTTSSVTLTDNTATSGSAYLYRVCVADGSGNCTSGYSNIALGARLNFSTDPTIISAADDPSGVTVTTMKYQHITELRTAVNAIRSLAGLSAGTWTHPNLASGDTIYKEDVSELRTKLDEALTSLGIQTSSYTDATLALTHQSNFSYDRFGNRKQKAAQNSQSLSYTAVEDADIDPLTNRLASNTTYDGGGNVTVDQKFRGTQYKYDANGRMWKSANIDSTGEATAVYDALGQRVQTISGGSTKTMVYDVFGKMIAEYDNQAQGGTGGTRYLMNDVQGSARLITSNDGSVLARHDYQAFGGEIGANVGLRTTGQKYDASDSTRQKYAMTERDGTGLDHTWWRKYESSAGRWTSPDPYKGSMSIGDPQSFNRYSYVHNDPVNFVDPSGLDEGLKEGLTEALNMVRNPSCGGLFSSRGYDPTQLINTYREKKLIKDGYVRGGEGTGAETYRNDPKGSKRIIINKLGFYYTEQVPSATGSGMEINIYFVEEFRGTNRRQMRAMVIIHELLHAIDAIPSDSAKNDPGGGQSRLNQQLVRIFCFDMPNQPVSTDTTVPNTQLILRPTGGGGGGGGYGWGGSYPGWWYSMMAFLAEINSITTQSMDDARVGVTACVGSDCP